MARLKIRYLVERPGAGGGVRYFWQPSAALKGDGWRLTRLPDERNAAIAEAEKLNASVDAWRAGELSSAEAGGAGGAAARRGQPRAGTVADLIKAYRASADFAALKPKTREGYDWCLELIDKWAGVDPWADIAAPDVAELYRAYAAVKPAKAAALVRTISLLWSWGRRNLDGFPDANPALRQRLKTPVRGGALWSPEAVTAFVAAADRKGWPSLGTAVLLNEWLGQREGDVIRLPRSAYQAGTITVRQSKRGATVELPVDLVPRLKLRLEAELARRADDDAKDRSVSTLLVNEKTGRPWDEYAFRKAIATVRQAAVARMRADNNLAGAAELAGLTFMRLRHTAVTRLAEAGASQSRIASVTGHTEASIRSIIEIYRVRTRAMAVDAFTLRLAREKKDDGA